MNSLDEYIHTPFASIRRQSIEPTPNEERPIYSMNTGSRIGVVYAIKEGSIHMHCIANGQDYGPFAIIKSDKTIDEQTKFWAFIDVYGATEKVRVIQVYGPSTLKSLCRSVIVSRLQSSDQIDKFLFFHKQLQSYLKFLNN